MRKITLALVLILFFCTTVFARIHVNPNDLATYKANFAEDITQYVNKTDQSDSVIYAYLIEAINNAWDTYTKFPIYVYSESQDNVSYTTLKIGDDRFRRDVVKLIEVQSKARLFRAIYTSMEEMDISKVLEPEWFMVAIQDKDDEVVYWLEVNPGPTNDRMLKDEVIRLLKKRSYMDPIFQSILHQTTYRITIATYVKKYDELVIDILFTDNDAKVHGEAVLTRDQIFGKLLAIRANHLTS